MKFKSISLNRQLSQYILTLKESWRIVLLLCLFICGLIIGSYAIKCNDSLLYSQLDEILKESIIKRNSMKFFNTFLDSFITDAVFLVITFAAGLCAIGIPAISIMPLIKGFSVGITGAYIYSAYSVKGVCYCLFVFFPAQIISSAILIFACNESFYMSADLFSTLNNNSLKEKNLVRLYLTRFGLFLLFSAVIALTDAFIYRVFSSVFAII